jgi:hypothetical protein
MDGVIHAVNAATPERVTTATLLKAAHTWNGRPLTIGHPVRDGRQCSANDPTIMARQAFGFIANSRMQGAKLVQEAWADVKKLEALGQHDLLARLREGRTCEVSVGAFVTTDDKAGDHNGKPFKATWLETAGDHLAFLPNGVGACSLAMGCGAHRAAMHLVTAEGFEALGDSPGHEFHGNQHTDGGSADKPGHEVHVRSDPHHARDKVAKRVQSNMKKAVKQLRRDGKHEEADKLETKRLKHEKDFGAPKGLSMNISDLKARVLALFDPSEQAVSEEVAELVKWDTLRATCDALGKQYKEVSRLIDELIEAEDVHAIGSGEQAETEIEAAKLDAIRTHCMAMSGSIGAILNSSYPTAVTAEPARYMEALRTLVGKRNSATDQAMIQTVHDHAAALGAECDKNNARYMSAIKTLEGKSLDERVQAVNMAVQKQYGSGNGLSPNPMYAYAQMVYDDHVIIRKDEKLYSVNYKVGKDGELTFSGEPIPVKQEYVAAATKDCERCDGTGQVKDDGKQSDCPACGGEGTYKAAERGNSAAEEGQMTKEQKSAAIKALTECHCSGFTAADIKTLEAFDDAAIERLTATSAARQKVDDDLKALQAKQGETEATLRAAQAAQIPAEELAGLRALAAEKQAADATTKADLVTKLAALKTLTKEQLEAKSLDDLRTLAAFAKVDVADYSVRGIPVQRAAEADSYAPPDPYAAGIKALQSKAVN